MWQKCCSIKPMDKINWLKHNRTTRTYLQYGTNDPQYTFSRLDKRIFPLFLLVLLWTDYFPRWFVWSGSTYVFKQACLLCFTICVAVGNITLQHTSQDAPYAVIMAEFPKSGQHYSRLIGTYLFSNHLYYAAARNVECQINASLICRKKESVCTVITESYIHQ